MAATTWLMLTCALVMVMAPLARVHAYPGYLMQIPNGLNFGMGISHEPDTRKLTPFGRMWSSWHNWAIVCTREFPDATDITTGAALGDPCCTWMPGETPDYILQAVSLEGTVCRNKSQVNSSTTEHDEHEQIAAATPVPSTAPPTSAVPAPTTQAPTLSPTTEKPLPPPTLTTMLPVPTTATPVKPAWHPSRWQAEVPRGYC